MILWLLLVVLVLWTAQFRFRRRRMYKLASKVAHPTFEIPIIGIAHKLSGNTEDIMTTLIQCSYEAMATNGVTRGWLNHIFYVLMVNPVDLEVVLKTCMEKDDLHRFIRKVIGFGGIFAPVLIIIVRFESHYHIRPHFTVVFPLKKWTPCKNNMEKVDSILRFSSLIEKGDTLFYERVSIWRRRRKILLPAFSPKIVEGFVEVFSQQSQIITRKLATMCGSPFNLWPTISAYSLDSVCETTMGVQVKAQTNSNSPFLICLGSILNMICERIFHLWLQPDWLFKFFPQYTKHQKYIKTLHDFTDEVIRKKRDELKNEKLSQAETAVSHFDLGNYKRKSFLDLLISLSGGEKGYTDLELREEILTLTVAGTDTSATALCFTLKLLGKYPEVQENLYEEIRNVFGDSNRPLVKGDLYNLKYLERVVKESLRLFPPVPFVIRKVETEITLPSGLTVPSGSGIVVSIFGAHRDPKYWGPDADHFDPDRFLPERFNLQHACSFMPFSNGPRNCVGYQYALMSIKTALTSILRHYKVIGEPEKGPIPNIRVKLDIMLKAVDGYYVTLEKRKPCPVTESLKSSQQG